MPDAMPDACCRHMPTQCRAHCRRSAVCYSTDGRTYGLTYKHLTVRWIGFATSRARAYTHFDDSSGEA